MRLGTRGTKLADGGRFDIEAMLGRLERMLSEVRACEACAHKLPLGPRPIVQIGSEAKLLIAGQAPGRKVLQTGVPFDDPSGDTLRAWLGIDRTTFYDPSQIAILPMAFCYPGRSRRGDLPPSPECAPLWRARLLALMPKVELTLVVGRYAQLHHLAAGGKAILAETVRAYQEYLPRTFPLPHPSPRNGPWLKRHPWFEAEVIPALRKIVAHALAKHQPRANSSAEADDPVD